MSAVETLRVQIDNLRLELQRAQVENARLRDENASLRDERPEKAAELDATLEATLKAEQLKLENENLQTELQELRRDLHESREREARTVEEAQGRIAELEHRARESETGRTTELEKDVERLTVRCEELENHLSREAERAELERYRTLEVERRKWEAREERLLEQLRQVEGQVRSGISPCVQDQELSEEGHSGGEPEMGGGISTTSLGEHASSPGRSATASPRPPPKSVRFTSVDQPEQASPRGDEPEQTGIPYQSALSTALLAQQLPPIGKFSGESSLADGETFEAWREQFEMVASVSHWDPQTKLVNLTTRLKGQAYTFYRSCAPHQRSSYDLLVAELMKRFTPVRLQSVQSSLFHERKQKASESVDAYAQDLRRLFHLAYPRAQQGSQEAEDMGRSVLASQFVAGLLPDIKLKLAGVEGSLDELLVKARFQEAKLRDLAGISSMVVTKKPSVPTSQHKSFGTNRAPENQVRSKPGIKCFHCQGTGHFAKHCPLKGRAVPEESRGRSQWMANKERGARKVATIAVTSGDQPVDEKTKKRQRIAELRRQLQEAEVEETMAEVVAMMHVLQPGEQQNRVPLGPTLTAEVKFEGRPVQALLDTGSPVTIVSLEFLLQTLAKQRPASQTVAEWQIAVKARLQPPSVTLQSYGGKELNIVRQVSTVVSRGDHHCEATILVQKNAPLDLLLGTDLQSKLGFFFLQSSAEEAVTDLLQKKMWKLSPVESKDQWASVDLPFPPESANEEERPTAVVRLITAARLPARHVKYVRAHVDNGEVKGVALFESEENLLRNKGLLIETAATQPDTNNCVTLAIQNHSLETVCLERGYILGSLYPATVIEESGSRPEDTSAERGVVRAFHSVQYQAGDETAPEIRGQPEPTKMPDRGEALLNTLDLGPATLEDEEREKLKELVLEYAQLFALNPSELGFTDVVQHTIDTGDSRPLRQLPRRIPFALRGKVEEMVEDMLERGVIQHSKSPWASPIVLVAKKDGTTRFCVDYRQLNAVTKMDVFPLPRVDDSLDLLANSTFFTTLDLATGYWQVKVSPESREKTAFVTHSGLYEFVAMPFGLCNAPATFQRLMESVLAGLARDTCLVYIDDILVLGRNFEEHLHNLRKVFNRLQEANLRLKPTKCHLARREVEYLGYIVSEKGIAADPRKVEAVQTFPVPNNLKGLRSFLGLASYYRRFIQNFSVIANPLYALTRKDAVFDWSPACQEAFDRLKMVLTNAPLLAFPDFNRDFLLETDASGIGLGAVLAQKQADGSVRPIAFASRTLQKHEKNYGITEMEALGVVWAVKHFRPYLYGHGCDVYTDHEALKSLLNTPQPSGKLARWGMALQELDLRIHYRPGKSNSNADALSRCPVETDLVDTAVPTSRVLLAAIQPAQASAKDGDTPLDVPTTTSFMVAPSIEERQHADPELAPIIEYHQTGTLPEGEVARGLAVAWSQYEVIEGLLYHLEPDKTLRVVLPKSDRKRVFDEAHAGPFGGHLRDAKVHGQLAKHYWWPRMRGDIIRWCRACLVCASRRVGNAITPPLTPIPVSGPFDRVGVDVIQFPKSYHGNQYAIVFVDYLTKWPEVFATSDQTAITIARLFVENVISRHGVPAELLSDRGTAFLSRLMQAVCEVMGVHKVNTTAYHPQTDGLVERFNRTLIDMLAKTVEKSGRDWDARLPYVLFAYRSSMQESTKESPFFLLYGRDPRLPTEEALSPPQTRQVLDIDDYRSELTTGFSEAWKLAQENVRKAQQKQKRHHDRRAKEPKLRKGDRVFVYMPAAKRGKAHKFARPFSGPYRVVELFNNGAEVNLIAKPKTANIRVAFNRIRRCPNEIPDCQNLDGSEPDDSAHPDPEEPDQSANAEEETSVSESSRSKITSDPNRDVPDMWKSRLRPRNRLSRDASRKDGEM